MVDFQRLNRCCNDVIDRYETCKQNAAEQSLGSHAFGILEDVKRKLRDIAGRLALGESLLTQPDLQALWDELGHCEKQMMEVDRMPPIVHESGSPFF